MTDTTTALATLRAMQCDHPGKDYPTSHRYPKEVRDAADVLEAEIGRLRDALEAIDAAITIEINPSNYDHDLVCQLNSEAVEASLIARKALEAPGHD